MGTLWFWIVAGMLAAYVVLDGFDLGVGIIYPFVARTEKERQQTLSAIGPVWDGNEVWLVASGGTLFFAFPLLYASAFSGFYLPLMIVLWLLMLRGMSIELRPHFHDPLWRTFFSGVFFVASSLLAIFLGAALANVIRGVPLDENNSFFLPLWTDWRTRPHPDILDWYTVIGGALGFVALAMHGALYLALKTDGAVQQRAEAVARKLWPVVSIATLVSIPATVVARPRSLHNYLLHPGSVLAPIAVAAGIAVVAWGMRRGAELTAFLGSCVYLAAMLFGAAAGLFPAMLPSSMDSSRDITVSQALAGEHTLRVGIVWWSFGILLACMYFVFIYWLFRGKVSEHSEGYGH
jgi:cytochrome bd ubiquinol oxidase subunit II